MNPWAKEFLECAHITDTGGLDWWDVMRFSSRFGNLNSTVGLIFRMVCWFSLHDFDKNDVNIMPADMKGSRMPVFIG